MLFKLLFKLVEINTLKLDFCFSYCLFNPLRIYLIAKLNLHKLNIKQTCKIVAFHDIKVASFTMHIYVDFIYSAIVPDVP